jgi:SAM-dependent methyltransferase
MCNMVCLQFGVRVLTPVELAGKSVLEVGAVSVNGSLRPVFEAWKPAEYVGVDLVNGPGVDRICRIEELVAQFGKDRFDLVIATEIIEHVQDWRAAISNIKNVCRRGGTMLITTPSTGFPYHAYPHDFWRYTRSDMERIFRDCTVDVLEHSEATRQVFLKARKPADFVETDLSDHRLYSIIVNEPVRDLTAAMLRKERRKKFVFDQVTLRVLGLANRMARKALF